MKKFWIVLLALGLVAGFAMSASAADVKFSGSYYVFGMYIDNPNALKPSKNALLGITESAAAFYHQRLRIQTEFKVAEGLSLVTRFDALETQWGDTAWGGTGNSKVNRPQSEPIVLGTAYQTRIQENIEFERAYIDFTTKIGRFNVGYQNFIAWGTMFLDTHVTFPGIKYFVPLGPATIVAAIEKRYDYNTGGGAIAAPVGAQASDRDYDVYDLGVIYKFGSGEAGLMAQFVNGRMYRQINNDYKVQVFAFNPYAKMKFGPVYVEAEGLWGFGKYSNGAADRDIDNAAALYLHAKADIGPAYVGGIFAFVSGDNPVTTTKVEGGIAAGMLVGQAWDPCLILFNDALYGGNHKMNSTDLGVFFDNAWLFQLYGGFKPMKNLDIMASLSYLQADRTALANQKYEYGYEFDLTATYKIFDNLEYMIGGGYVWTGDYFRYGGAYSKVDNNYMILHKLTLSF